jgi:hypothetical protein
VVSVWNLLYNLTLQSRGTDDVSEVLTVSRLMIEVKEPSDGGSMWPPKRWQQPARLHSVIILNTLKHLLAYLFNISVFRLVPYGLACESTMAHTDGTHSETSNPPPPPPPQTHTHIFNVVCKAISFTDTVLVQVYDPVKINGPKESQFVCTKERGNVGHKHCKSHTDENIKVIKRTTGQLYIWS